MLTDSIIRPSNQSGYLAEYLLLQVWAPPYRFKNDKKTAEINHTRQSTSITMKKLILLFSLLSGCTISENINTLEGQANIAEIIIFNQTQSGVAIVAKGFYWPSYEGSVICQTKKFETCLFVALNERNYKKYLGQFEKGQFVNVSGRFEWVNLEAKKKQFEESSEILPHNPWHRIINVKSIVGVKK